MIGIVIFATASALCGATPDGSIAEAWIIFCRVVQGARRGDHVPGRAGDRRRRLPARGARQGDGGLLRDRRRPDRDRPARRRLPDRDHLAHDLLDQRPGRDRGDPADAAGRSPTTPSVRRSSTTGARCWPRSASGSSSSASSRRAHWGWDSPATIGSIVVGLALIAAFVRAELDTDPPLMQVRIFAQLGLRGRQPRPAADLDRLRADVPVREHVLRRSRSASRRARRASTSGSSSAAT